MIQLPLPFALVLAGALFWPVTLGAAALLAAIGLLVANPWVRVPCLILAGLLAADCLLALTLP